MIQSAQAAQAGFEEIKRFLSAHPQQDSSHQPLDSKGAVLATVHGDVHDIGKNIVKVILENYGFPVKLTWAEMYLPSGSYRRYGNTASGWSD